jgi:hypothetical protein
MKGSDMREIKDSATIQIRISSELYRAAAVEGQKQHRSIRGQLEKWIEDARQAEKAAAKQLEVRHG